MYITVYITLCVPMSLLGLSFTLHIPVCLVTHLPFSHSTNCPVPCCFTCNCFHSHSSTVSPLFIASLFCFELCTVEKEIVAKLPIFEPMVFMFFHAVGPFIIMFCSVNPGSLIIISLFFSLFSAASA